MRVTFSDSIPPPHRTLCTDCGVSRTDHPERCATACQFIRPDYPTAERRIHGRKRKDGETDERFFGVIREMSRARMIIPAPGAQWTGITTSIAANLLETDQVDAVLTVTADPDDRWKPLPVLVTEPDELADCRGMRMGFSPLLALLSDALEHGHRRLAVIGIPCQVYALRALEAKLGFDRLLVIGTPCSDNTTTENFHQFLALLSDQPETINYLEFRADYQVELRFDDGRQQEIPFLQLPIADLPQDFFPITCRTCVDYTNTLADVTVGYMGGEGDQWIIVRNPSGQRMEDGLSDRLVRQPPASKGRRMNAVKGFQKNTELAGAGLPLRRMPGFLRPLVAWLMPRTGPRGLEFARARVEMKAIETIVHLRREFPARIKHMVPTHVWKLAATYGYTGRADELPETVSRKRATKEPK